MKQSSDQKNEKIKYLQLWVVTLLIPSLFSWFSASVPFQAAHSNQLFKTPATSVCVTLLDVTFNETDDSKRSYLLVSKRIKKTASLFQGSDFIAINICVISISPIFENEATFLSFQVNFAARFLVEDIRKGHHSLPRNHSLIEGVAL